MPYYMEFSQAVGMHAGFLRWVSRISRVRADASRPRSTGFSNGLILGTPVTVAGNTGTSLLSERLSNFSIEIPFV